MNLRAGAENLGSRSSPAESDPRPPASCRSMNKSDFAYRVPWNLFLITCGAVLFSFGIQAVVVQHGFITGGLYGIGLLIAYATNSLPPALWYLLLNIPLFAVGWVFVSRRFFFYSVYATAMISFGGALIHHDLGIDNQLYAAILGGVLCGAGSGLILRSLGSGGGMDVVAIILNQKFNLGIGKFYLFFNAVLFALFLAMFDVDLVIASLILVFVSAKTMDYTLAAFSQRKLVFIVSDQTESIARCVLDELKQGATFISARGAYHNRSRDMLMAITNNIQLKRMEELVFTVDPNALFIVENTFSVIGSTFGKRKIY